jgi:hypothetical protein
MGHSNRNRLLARLAIGLSALGVAATPLSSRAQSRLTDLEQVLCSALGPEKVVTSYDRQCAAVRAAQQKAEDTHDAAERQAAQQRAAGETAHREAEQRRRATTVEDARTAADEERLRAINASAFSEAQKAALRARRLATGATPEMARLAWGEPRRIIPIPSVAGNRVRWAYQSGGYLYFENGALTAIVTPR